MNNTREYTINFAMETITITKRFGREASEFDTPEFRTMQMLREQYKGFKFQYKVIKKNKKKKSYKGLTIEEMKRFVETQSKEELAVFEKVIALAETKQSKYAIVKKWFMNHYKDAYAAEVENQKTDKELEELAAELEEIEDGLEETEELEDAE